MTIQSRIVEKLKETFQPSHLEVLNESHQHSVAPGSETHFKIIIATNHFEGQSLVNRHRTIYELLKTEIASGVHALAIHAMTESEWLKKQQELFKSPPCLGGSKKD